MHRGPGSLCHKLYDRTLQPIDPPQIVDSLTAMHLHVFAQTRPALVPSGGVFDSSTAGPQSRDPMGDRCQRAIVRSHRQWFTDRRHAINYRAMGASSSGRPRFSLP